MTLTIRAQSLEQSSRVQGGGGQGEVAVPLLHMIELKDWKVLVDDELTVPEQLTEHLQRSSPTGRMAAYHSDIEGVKRSHAFIEVIGKRNIRFDFEPVDFIHGPAQAVAQAIGQRQIRRHLP